MIRTGGCRIIFECGPGQFCSNNGQNIGWCFGARCVEQFSPFGVYLGMFVLNWVAMFVVSAMPSFKSNGCLVVVGLSAQPLSFETVCCNVPCFIVVFFGIGKE